MEPETEKSRISGTITDIHRSSFVDGPGIRTTVFLKGCPLSCVWCHNPETQECHRQLGFNASKCIGCGACVNVCPRDALSIDDAVAALDRTSCDDCLQCVDVCPSSALFTYGKSITVDDVMAVILKDTLYYDESGGGMTVSGGEPMMQAGFTLELLRRCRDAGIHTCLDTTGTGRADDFQQTLDCTDLYLFDYKATDPNVLKQLTGASRKTVMRTFQRLYDAGARIRLRCPMIPGVNDTEEHLQAIARISREYDLDGVDILMWHTMGTSKYDYLGKSVSEDLPKANADKSRRDYYMDFFENARAAGVDIKG